MSGFPLLVQKKYFGLGPFALNTLIHYIYTRLFEHKGLNKGNEAEGVCGLSVGKFDCKILKHLSNC